MKIYEVGGAVRDALLGLPVKERDWVVVGRVGRRAAAHGFKRVGKDFPVFLHPDDRRGIRARAHRAQGRAGLHGVRVRHLDDRDARAGSRTARPHDQRHRAHGRRRDRRSLVRPRRSRATRTASRIAGVSRGPTARAARRTFRGAIRQPRLHRSAPRHGADARDRRERRDGRAAARARLAGDREGARHGPARTCISGCCATAARSSACSRRSTRCSACRNPSAGIRRSTRGVHVLLALRVAARLSPRETVRFAVLTHDLGKARDAAPLLPQHHGHERRSEQLLGATVRAAARAESVSRSRAARRATSRHRASRGRAEAEHRAAADRATSTACASPAGSRSSCSRARPTCAAARASRTAPYPQAERLRIALRAARAVDARKVKARSAA